MIFRFLAHVALWLLGAVCGDAARTRSRKRAAVNPARERTWTFVKAVLGISVLAWLFGFGGMHTLFGGL